MSFDAVEPAPGKATDKRLPKQFGDFAESLVMYILGKHKGARVALVDHVGADIIATDPGRSARFAISVKGRNIPPSESKAFHFGEHDVEMLRDFSDSFALIPAVAFVFADDMEGEQKIRVLMVRLDEMSRLAVDSCCSFLAVSPRGGFHINYGKTARMNRLGQIRESGVFDYTELTFDALDEFLAI